MVYSAVCGIPGIPGIPVAIVIAFAEPLLKLFNKRRTRRQLWRDRLKSVKLEDFERGPLLGIGGFGRWVDHNHDEDDGDDNHDEDDDGDDEEEGDAEEQRNVSNLRFVLLLI